MYLCTVPRFDYEFVMTFQGHGSRSTSKMTPDLNSIFFISTKASVSD